MKKQLLTLAAFFALTASASAQTFENGATSYSISYVSGASNQTCFANFKPSSGGAAFAGGNVNAYTYANDGATPAVYSAMQYTGKATAPDFELETPFWMNLSQAVGTCESMSSQAVPGGYNAINMTNNPGFLIRAKSTVEGTVLRIYLGYYENTTPGTNSYNGNILKTITLTTSYADYIVDFSDWATRSKVNMYGFIIENDGAPVVSVEGVSFGGTLVTSNNNANVVNDEVSLYPNPAKAAFKVDMTAMNNSDAAAVKVMNANGVIVKEFSSNSNVEEITTEGLNKGIYLVQVTSGNKIATKKVVVE